jgi:uroporphyrinogen decarboxylase
MTPRQRLIDCLTFRSVDRVPFEPGGPRESTLRRWRSEGLPENADHRVVMAETLGLDLPATQPPVDLGTSFLMIPQFEEKVLEHRDGHYVVQDWKGNVCEISDQYDVSYLRVARDFVTRAWIRCPVENRDDWEQMKQRYDVNDPARFPDDFAQRCARAAERDWLLTLNFHGPFWQMREWCGFEGLCMMMIEQPDLVAEMAAFWTDFVEQVLARVYRHITPDRLLINEDMAYKQKAMISPAMTREFCKPSWDRWASQAKAAGVVLLDLDSDGFVGELLPIWIESGLNVNDPLEVAAGNDINAFRQQHDRTIAFRQGIDKRCIARGGQSLRDELARVEPVMRDGGYIPGCDHGVPHDISWPNWLDYCGLLARMTGWL